MPGLLSLKNLRVLSISVREKSEEQYIIRSLPKLEYLNDLRIQLKIQLKVTAVKNEQDKAPLRKGGYPNYGLPSKPKVLDESPHQTSSRRAPTSKNTDADIGMKQEDLESVGALFDCIRELYKEKTPDRDNILAEEFEDHVKNVMTDLTQKLYHSMGSRVLASMNILKAKFGLYEICFAKVIDFANFYDPRLLAVLEGIHGAHHILFNEMADTVVTASQIPLGSSNTTDNSKLIAQIGSLENELQKLRLDKENLIKTIEQERLETHDQMATLQEENAKYLNAIIKHSKENAEVNLSKNTPGPVSLDHSFNRGFESNYDKRQHQKLTTIGSGETHSHNQTLKNNQSILNQSTAYVGHTSLRALTVKQLKDVIEEIYASKTKYDQRCLESRIPRETMEQHMYTFLNQKYGLKTLIIEWASAIVNGIKKFSPDDNDVAVFGKILRNECDEEFRFVQAQVKTTIQELLKMYLRSKFPLKTNAEINEMLAVKSGSSITEEECLDIVNYMYNKDDADFLISKISKYYQYPKRPMIDPIRKKMSREEQAKLLADLERQRPTVDYASFQKVILDFQLRSHEKFLKNFIIHFRSVDPDQNGILNESEFRDLVRIIESYNIPLDSNRLLMTIDPYSHQQITFSQCVSLFSSEMTRDGENQLSILQKISRD